MVLENSQQGILVSHVAKSESAANVKHVFPHHCFLVLQKAIQLFSTATEMVEQLSSEETHKESQCAARS